MYSVAIAALFVSIHAPREGCDAQIGIAMNKARSFNSRTPGGVRPIDDITYRLYILFQFTHPGRGATEEHVDIGREELVSIHAPREGCDLLRPPMAGVC